MKHIIPTDLINKVLNYLAGKAYSEVAILIGELKEKSVLYTEPEAPLVPPVSDPMPSKIDAN